jgi:hypothetical protein
MPLPEVSPETTDAAAVALALAEALAGEEPAEPLAEAAPAVVRPMPRPPALRLEGVTEVAASLSAERDPGTIAPGTRLVQLGTLPSAEAARAEWQRLSDRFGSVMAAKAMVLQPAQSAGHTFWRLRAEGFADEDDARRFCQLFLAENASCVPVTHR